MHRALEGQGPRTCCRPWGHRSGTRGPGVTQSPRQVLDFARLAPLRGGSPGRCRQWPPRPAAARELCRRLAPARWSCSSFPWQLWPGHPFSRRPGSSASSPGASAGRPGRGRVPGDTHHSLAPELGAAGSREQVRPAGGPRRRGWRVRSCPPMGLRGMGGQAGGARFVFPGG